MASASSEAASRTADLAAVSGVDDAAPAQSSPATPAPHAATADMSTTTASAAAAQGASARYTLRLGRVTRVSDSHWAYALVQAVIAGDTHVIDLLADAPSFDPACLTAPIDDASGSTLIHVAALSNQPSVLTALLAAAERVAVHTPVRAQQLSLRADAVRPHAHDASAATRLDHALVAYERLAIMRSEQLYMDVTSTKDAAGRTALHYAAGARGVMVEAVLGFRAGRFTHDLFPHGSYVNTSTGALWHAEAGAATGLMDDANTAAGGVPPGFIPVSMLGAMRLDAAFIDAQDDSGATPLLYATVAGDTRAIKSLLEHGADIFTRTLDGLAPLDLASNRVIRSALIPMDNVVHAACGTPLPRAGYKSPSATVRTTGTDAASAHRSEAEHALVLLVSSGTDINGRAGIHMRAPLHVAAEQGALEVVQLLLNNGAVVDIVDVNGCTPLHLAAELGSPMHQQIVRLLADAGADVNATTSVRKTALHLAATGGPSFNAQTSGSAPLEADATSRSSSDPAADTAQGTTSASMHNSDSGRGMIALLVRLGCTIEGVDTERNTALHAAAKRGNHAGAEMLLTLGARAYAANIRGHTPLHVAAFHHNIPTVRLLCRWDAEVGKLKHILDSSGRSAYDLGADPATRDAMHTLFEACACGKLDLAQSVYRSGALAASASGGTAWAPVQPWDVTRVLRRSCIHVAVTGAARAMAMHRAGAGTPSTSKRGGVGEDGVRVNASAVHTVAGIGFRFIPTLAAVTAALPPAASWHRTAWGSSKSDVTLRFYEHPDETVTLYVDSYAYAAPRDESHSRQGHEGRTLGGSTATSGSMLARRQVPGSELTSSQTEKEFGRVIEWLLRVGGDANGPDIDGVTPLMLATRYGLLFIMRRLLSAGARTSMRDRVGNTAFHYARAFVQDLAHGILEEFTEDAAQVEVTNDAGASPRSVAAAGISILPYCTERLVTVDAPPPRSATLHVSRAV